MQNPDPRLWSYSWYVPATGQSYSQANWNPHVYECPVFNFLRLIFSLTKGNKKEQVVTHPLGLLLFFMLLMHLCWLAIEAVLKNDWWRKTQPICLTICFKKMLSVKNILKNTHSIEIYLLEPLFYSLWLWPWRQMN